jgi:16S rRNA (guanine966-N2)-methyltransferase
LVVFQVILQKHGKATGLTVIKLKIEMCLLIAAKNIMRKVNLSNKVRVIGGKWRGRKIPFTDVKSLRPTPCRIRETLFNWLAPIIRGSCCLDLFAGSGILGFEALSRGAKEVVFVDSNEEVVAQLKEAQKILNCDNMRACQLFAEQYLKQTNKAFNLVFLDPPFRQGLLQSTMAHIEDSRVLEQEALLYLETESSNTLCFSESWEVMKNQQIGRVRFYLIKRK